MEIPNTVEWKKLLKQSRPGDVVKEVNGTVYLRAEPHLAEAELRWLQRTAKYAPSRMAFFYRLPPKAIDPITQLSLGHPRPNNTIRLEDGRRALVRMTLLPKSTQSRSLTGLAVLQILAA